MKHLNLILLLLTFTTFISCKKEAPVNPIDQLPPASAFGANTFGCLINGSAFVPKKGPWYGGGGDPYLCYYRYDDDGKGPYFILAAYNLKDSSSPDVILEAQNLTFEEGKTYPLTTWGEDGKAFASYTVVNSSWNRLEFYTTETTRGELKITRFDEVKQIISGTFWFNAINDSGSVIEVREGRFDMTYMK
jgi:hypothetical protein